MEKTKELLEKFKENNMYSYVLIRDIIEELRAGGTYQRIDIHVSYLKGVFNTLLDCGFITEVERDAIYREVLEIVYDLD